MYKACLAAWGLTTYVCTATMAPREPSGLISRALQKLLIIIIITLTYSSQSVLHEAFIASQEESECVYLP